MKRHILIVASSAALMISRLFRGLLLLACVPASLRAGSYIVPLDAELIRATDSIAIVRIDSSVSYFTDDGAIVTDYWGTVERGLKSAPRAGTAIVVTQRGGVVGATALSISTEPTFMGGERALLLMRRLAGNRFTTWSGQLGKFSFVTDIRSRELLVRGATPGEIFGWDLAGARHDERLRDAAAFIRYIERVVASRDPAADYVVEPQTPVRVRRQIDSHVSGNDYMMQFNIGGTSRGSRWEVGSFTAESVGTQSAVSNLGASIDTARGAWNGAPASISIGYAGSTTGGSYGSNDGRNLMFFDQPNSDPLTGGTVGQATLWASSQTHSNGSDTYFSSLDCDIIIKEGLTGSLFEAVLAHELGHCLGLRHSNEPGAGQTTFTTDALMNSVSSGGATATLRAWDQDAASHVYGAGGSTCTPPSIVAHPQSTTIQAGQSTPLSVSAGGTAPLSFQWYIGSTGNTASPIAGATGTSLTVSPTTTTSYWVRVTGQCGSPADSNTATVTVAACIAPSITSHPQSTSIQPGQVATLSVGATGTAPLFYQWYIGNSGDTGLPIAGATSSSINVSPSSTTSYWVRVTGQCGSPADSAAATVTVAATCTPPFITFQPQSVTIQPGQTANLSVVAGGTGPLFYQWYIGASGNTTNPVAGGTSATISVSPAVTTTYWIRVTGQCGSPVNSAAATVTVTSACVGPAISSTTQSQSVSIGTRLTLTVSATGTAPLQYAWFQGEVGDASTQIGTGATVTSPPLTANTRFWVRVTNACGTANSGPIDIRVTPARRRAVGR